MAFADLVLLDHDSGLAPVDLRRFSHALADQLRDDVAPVWGRYVVPWVGAVQGSYSPRTWKLHFWSTPRAAHEKGAYGYHATEGDDHVPVGHVFVETTRRAGEEWSVIASHEALEMVADEWVNLEVTRKGHDGTWELWPREICVAGETRVDLADGTQRTIRELAEDPRPFSVRTVAGDGRRGVGSAVAWRTARGADVVRVRLVDGREIRCTPYHKFMLADGSYKAAGKLEPGDRLYSDVSPRLASTDLTDRRVVDVVPGRQRHDRIGTVPDRPDGVLRELAVTDQHSTKVAVSRNATFAGGVGQILSVRPDEEVGRSDAARGVAMVTDLRALRDVSYLPLVGQAVRELNPTPVTNLPVPVRAGGALPDPTGRGLVDAGPEPLLERGGASVVRRAPAPWGVGGPGALLSTEMGRAESVGQVRASARLDRAGAGHGPVVDTVQPAGKDDVYDLHVPGTHNFSVEGGVYVHNCDAVQGLSYAVGGVRVSDFVYPEWFIPGSDGPFDHMRVLTKPFEIHPSGYAAIRRVNGGRVTARNVYGAAYPQWRKKKRWLSRKARRI